MAISVPVLFFGLLSCLMPQFCFAQAPGAAPAEPPPALTLTSAYQYALRRSETVAIRREVITETRGRYLQALGRALPQLSFGFDYTRQSVPPGTTIPSFFARRSTTAERLTLSQTLYPGASEFTAVSIAGVERQQRVAEWNRERQLLLGDVSEAFFLVLEQQETVVVLRDIDRVLAEQQTAINERIRVGRSRVSERVNTQVLIAQNQAAVEQVVFQGRGSRDLLASLTGLPQIGALVDTGPTLPAVESRERYEEMAASRPDVIAAEKAVVIAQRQVSIAKSAFFPTFSLNGNYYLHRTGPLSGFKWDITLTADLPLLPVVQTLGTIRQNQALVREAELQYRLTSRTARLDVDTAWDNLQSALAVQRANQKAVDAATENYRLQQQDYQLSLINTIEFLQSIQSLQQVRLNYISAVYQTKRAYWQLLVAAGRTP